LKYIFPSFIVGLSLQSRANSLLLQGWLCYLNPWWYGNDFLSCQRSVNRI